MPELEQARVSPTQLHVPALGLLWLALAAGYLVASAVGHRALAIGIVGLMAGALIATSGHRVAGLLAGTALGAACLYWSDSMVFLVYFPPLFAFAFMAYFFYRTLGPGIEPLITRVARKEHPCLSPEVVRFTRALTWAWSLCFVLLFVAALLLAYLLPLDSWSRWVHGLGYVVPATLFLGEYLYRHRRFPDLQSWIAAGTDTQHCRRRQRRCRQTGHAEPPGSRPHLIMLPLARYRAPGDPVLIGPGGETTAAEFFFQVQELANALPSRGFVINLCETRHGFMLGFAAALLRGQTSLLPPVQGRRDWELLLQRYPDAYLLSESAGVHAAGDGVLFFEAGPFMSRDACAAARDATELQVPHIDRELTAAIMFTSGSTGQPTAHAKTWEQLCLGAAGLAKALQWANGCAVVGSVPPQHMYGLETTVMLPWFTGIPVHAQKPLLPADLEIVLRQSACKSWWITTPLHLRALLRGAAPLSGMAGVVASTMSLPVALACAAEAAWNLPVLEIYGSTESGTLATRRTATETQWSALQDVSLRYAPERGSEGGQGRRVQASGAHFDSPVLLGDELDILPDGRFLWIGRSGDLIKVGGKRASLSALNQNLTDIEGVSDGVCFFPGDSDSNASDDTHPSHRLAAMYVSSTLSPQEVIGALRARIDPVFVPRPIFRVAQLPRNANGKLPGGVAGRLVCAVQGGRASRTGGAGFRTASGNAQCHSRIHPCPGIFPATHIVPGVVILARVADAIRDQFPHIELGALLHARFHAPLKPGEIFCIRPQLQDGVVRFEVHSAAASTGSRPESDTMIASGRWEFRAPVCGEPDRQ